MAMVAAETQPRNPTGKVADNVPEDIPRDRWKRPRIYKLSKAGTPTKTLEPYTRASTLGGYLEDQSNLGVWKQQMVAFGMARRRALVLAAAAVPTSDLPEDKAALRDIARQALDAAESSAKATIGTALHALSERVDRGLEIPDIGEDQRALDAYKAAMVSFTWHEIEMFVVCDEVRCAGTFDRLVSCQVELTAPDGTVIPVGSRMIMDLKTSSSADYFGIKFAVQLAVYAHGLPYGHKSGRGTWPDELAPRTDWALILHVPSGGAMAEWHWVDLTLGWELAKLARSVGDWRSRKDIVTPAGPIGDQDNLMAELAASHPADPETGRRLAAVPDDPTGDEIADGALVEGSAFVDPDEDDGDAAERIAREANERAEVEAYEHAERTAGPDPDEDLSQVEPPEPDPARTPSAMDQVEIELRRAASLEDLKAVRSAHKAVWTERHAQVARDMVAHFERAAAPSKVAAAGTADAPVTEPAGPALGTPKDPITVALRAATTVLELKAVHRDNKAAWTDVHTALAAALRNRLERQAREDAARAEASTEAAPSAVAPSAVAPSADDPIAEALRSCTDVAGLKVVRKSYRADGWTDAHAELARELATSLEAAAAEQVAARTAAMTTPVANPEPRLPNGGATPSATPHPQSVRIGVMAELKACTTVPELKAVYARNRAEWDDECQRMAVVMRRQLEGASS
jgi:hypothetical protein